jgi:HEAT repeat protein
MMAAVKFLRRSFPQDDVALPAGAGVDLISDLQVSAATAPPEDAATVARAVLLKLDILQGRDKKVRLIRSIARLDSAWACAVLFELLGDVSEEIRDLAVRHIAPRGDCPMDRLYGRLQQPPWYVKSAILRIFCLRRDAGAVSAIGAVVDDPNVEVRRWAALALGRIGGPDARSLLVHLSKDRNPYVKQAATDALDKVCDFKFS